MGVGADGITKQSVRVLSRIVTEVICWDNRNSSPAYPLVPRLLCSVQV